MKIQSSDSTDMLRMMQKRFLFPVIDFEREEYSAAINEKILIHLYALLFKSTLVIAVLATFFTLVLWQSAEHDLLFGWYALIMSVTVKRFYDALQFKKHFVNTMIGVWYGRFYIATIASAILWGITPLLFFPQTDTIMHMFISITIIGLSAGAVTTLVSDHRLSYIYLYLLLLPLSVTLLAYQGMIYGILSGLVLLFTVFTSSAMRLTHATLLNTLETEQRYLSAKTLLESSEKRHRLMFEQSPSGNFYYDTNLNIVDCNSAFGRIMHLDQDALIGLSVRHLPDSRPVDIILEKIDAGQEGVFEGIYDCPQVGKTLWLKMQLTPLIDQDGKNIGGLGIVEDKTLEHQALKEAEFLDLYDSLTQLPNRKLLKEQLLQRVRENRVEKRFFAIMLMDIDRFKNVNDAYGHEVGDQLIVETSQRVRGVLRENDGLSRPGVDEFVVILPLLSDKQDQASYMAYQSAKRVHTAISEPFVLDAHKLYVTCSIGIVIVSPETIDADEIMHRADIAMYQAKNDGRNRTRFYEAALDEKTRANIYLAKNLRTAIEKEELRLNYQPILHIQTNELCGAEVLLRWEHETEGSISPSDFIPIAEESGLIHDIGKWTIEQACFQLQQWRTENDMTLRYLTINISPVQLDNQDFGSFLLTCFEKYELPTNTIKFEITEHSLIENFGATRSLIEMLNARGVEFVIDDFGTGYSSLMYLKALPFSTLKIDRDFVRDIFTSPDDVALIEAMIGIARQFGYVIVAEGVETEAQRDKLKTLDSSICYQGYLGSKPCDAGQFETKFSFL